MCAFAMEGARVARASTSLWQRPSCLSPFPVRRRTQSGIACPTAESPAATRPSPPIASSADSRSAKTRSPPPRTTRQTSTPGPSRGFPTVSTRGHVVEAVDVAAWNAQEPRGCNRVDIASRGVVWEAIAGASRPCWGCSPEVACRLVGPNGAPVRATECCSRHASKSAERVPVRAPTELRLATLYVADRSIVE